MGVVGVGVKGLFSVFTSMELVLNLLLKGRFMRGWGDRLDSKWGGIKFGKENFD